MASKTPENGNDQGSAQINKKILELKKKLLLAEGQKKAYIGEWTQREKQNSDLVTELKKDIKELTGKLTYLNNANSRKSVENPQEVVRKIPYPPGAKTAEEAVQIVDLKFIDLTKQLDLLNDKYLKRKTFFDNLLEQYHEALANKNDNQDPAVEHVPSTIEEAESRKLICHLENSIHKKTTQWMEAEHIFKKYKSIKVSLMADSEKFEKSLLELEEAITDQQVDIARMQQIHNEAIQMRDATKIILMRQEHAAHVSTRSRERQAFDFRRQVEERKAELERLERKLFSTGKALIHQGSMESTNDQQTGKKVGKQDSNAQAQEMTSEMEMEFKTLMETTGATTTVEVLEALHSTKGINISPKLPENKTSKFSDVKENEINQEQVEQFKNTISEEQQREEQCMKSYAHTNYVISSIKSTLLDLVLKLQEVDEAIDPVQAGGNIDFQLEDLISGNIANDLLLRILEDKLRKGLISSGQVEKETCLDEDDLAIKSPCPTPRTTSALDERERLPPQAFPTCYSNLMAGRTTTGQISSASPGQANQPAPTDDEGDVPSRGFLKRQAQYIVDSKSRRKGFRVARR
ncbi:hypothetical protein HA402_002412 [Bradysia odoriphaga]|nr:hypothetical protein HA402_002412 [Bradysia odoriphaga]